MVFVVFGCNSLVIGRSLLLVDSLPLSLSTFHCFLITFVSSQINMVYHDNNLRFYNFVCSFLYRFLITTSINLQLVIHFYTLRTSCCLCSSFFRNFDKFSRNSLVRTKICSIAYAPICWANVLFYRILFSEHILPLSGIDGSIVVADGKVQPCFQFCWEAYATSEGLSLH